jgi:hypothetical protein
MGYGLDVDGRTYAARFRKSIGPAIVKEERKATSAKERMWSDRMLNEGM